MHTPRKAAPLLGLSTLVMLGLTAALPRPAAAQVKITASKTSPSAVTATLSLVKGANHIAVGFAYSNCDEEEQGGYQIMHRLSGSKRSYQDDCLSDVIGG